MKDIRGVLGFRDPFIKLGELLEKDIQALKEKPELWHWARLESRLYLMSYLLTDLKQDDFKYLSDLLAVVLQLPISFIRIRNTVIAIIGKAAKYLATMYHLSTLLEHGLTRNLGNRSCQIYSSSSLLTSKTIRPLSTPPKRSVISAPTMLTSFARTLMISSYVW